MTGCEIILIMRLHASISVHRFVVLFKRLLRAVLRMGDILARLMQANGVNGTVACCEHVRVAAGCLPQAQSSSEASSSWIGKG